MDAQVFYKYELAHNEKLNPRKEEFLTLRLIRTGQWEKCFKSRHKAKFEIAYKNKLSKVLQIIEKDTQPLGKTVELKVVNQGKYAVDILTKVAIVEATCLGKH